MENLQTLNEDYFTTELLPSEKSTQRVIKFLPKICSLLILLLIGWNIFWIIKGFYSVAFVNVVALILFSTILFLLKEKWLGFPTHLFFITSMTYIFLMAILASGNGIDHLGCVHYWFIPIIVGVHLCLPKNATGRLVYSSIALLTFVIIEYGLIPFEPLYDIPVSFKVWQHAITTISCLIITILFLATIMTDINSAESELSKANNKMEGLLFNILPPKIAQKLKTDGHTFAEGFVDCSVLFADLVGFTSWCSNKKPEEIVKVLHKIFSEFDDLIEQYDLEKIKTIGDAYMVASGIPEKNENHAYEISKFAIKMLEVVNKYPEFKLRVGINSGKVVAGIIGKKRFIYDLWGDAVNIASRMESSGKNGKIQISIDTYNIVKNYKEFNFENRANVEIKGKGFLNTFFLGPVN